MFEQSVYKRSLNLKLAPLIQWDKRSYNLKLTTITSCGSRASKILRHIFPHVYEDFSWTSKNTRDTKSNVKNLFENDFLQQLLKLIEWRMK